METTDVLFDNFYLSYKYKSPVNLNHDDFFSEVILTIM